jgi:DNA-binding NarL/FixJ family response regulator
MAGNAPAVASTLIVYQNVPTVTMVTPLREGASYGEIKQDLVISVTTVRTHVSNILSKLGVSNRVEAIALALRNKLVV